MSESVLAACQDCGKKYRVPSADRDYACKACGGTVTASSPALEEEEVTEQRERPRRTPRKKKSPLPIYLGTFAAVAAAGVGIWFVMGGGEASASGERDLTKVAAMFDDAWNDGDLDRIGNLLHPQQNANIQSALRTVKNNRGWTEGFVEITGNEVPTDGLLPGMMAAENKDGETVETGLTIHDTASGKVVGRWQFSEAREQWMLYSLEIPAPELGPRLTGFAEAWNSGDQARIQEYLQPDKPDRLFEAFAKVADRDGWDVPFPPVSDMRTDPSDLAELRDVGFRLTYPAKATATFETKYGRMGTTWRLWRETDNWYIASFKPPK